MPECIDLDRICRLCLKRVKEEELVGIFENYENCSLPVRIMACAALEVHQNDALPKNMCTDCRYSLEKFYLFRKKSKNADTKLRRHLRLINAGKVSNLFDEVEDLDDYEECLAFIAKWDAKDESKNELMKRQEVEKCRLKQEKDQLEKGKKEIKNFRRKKHDKYQSTSRSLLKRNQQFEVSRNECQEMSIKNEPSAKTTIHANKSEKLKTLTADCMDVEDVEYIETLYVLEGSSNHSDEYELITDEPNNYNDTFEVADGSEIIDATAPDRSNYILSGHDDKIKIAFADGESGINTDDEDYTNAEYLEMDDEETQVEEIIPLKYSSISKIIRETIASCSGISADREGVDCKLFKEHGKSTKIAVTTDDDPDKTFYLRIQEKKSNKGKQSAHRCNISSKSYRSMPELNKRNQTLHAKKSEKNCDWCSKIFFSGSALRRHLRIHTGEKPFKCDECGKSFCQKEILKRHQMIHSGEKPYSCSWCDKAFAQRLKLDEHINRKHSANPVIKLHKCGQCSKKTSSIFQSSSVAPASASHSTPRDEIYIDDEGLEGSGGRGEIHDDLEKEPEYSGSGFGEDDEDSSSNHHTPHHNTNTNNRKDQTDLELGSGDDGDNDDDGDDDFTTETKHKEIDSSTSDDEDLDIGEPKIGTERKSNTGSSPNRDDNEIDLDPDHTRQGTPTEKVSGTGQDNQEVLIMNTKSEDRTASFFAQPGILAAVIGGAVVGLLCAILVVMFIVYRMRKKDEGSYALDEPKRSPAVNSYAKNANNREFYA